MKGFIRYITENWIWISTGCIFTGKAVEYAYMDRGGVVAYGGEWLVLPVILFSVHLTKEIVMAVAVVFLDGGDNE